MNVISDVKNVMGIVEGKSLESAFTYFQNMNCQFA
jgi:hypothetical protein